MLICGDSSITHMADAFGILLVSVVAQCKMHETQLVGKVAVVIQEFPSCAPGSLSLC